MPLLVLLLLANPNPLVDELYHETREVRIEAVRKLRAMGPEATDAVSPLQELLGGDRVLDRLIKRALVAIGNGPRPALLVHLKSKTATLGDVTLADLDEVVQALESKDPRVRGQAAYVVRRLAPRDPKLLDALANALDVDSPYARWHIHKTLRLYGRSALSVFLSELKHADVRRRRLGANALTAYGIAVGKLPELQAALADEDLIVRRSIIMAIGNLRGRGAAAVPQLVTLLDDPELTHSALSALFLMGKFAADAVPAITRLIESEDVAIRRRACEALMYFGPAAEPAVPALIRACFDEDWQVMSGAMRALGPIGPKAAAAAPYLAELSEAHPMARGFAQQTLKRIGAGAPLPKKSDDIEALIAQLADGNGQAAFQLGRLEPHEGPALPALRDALGDDDPYVRMHAALALGRLGAMKQLVDAVEEGGRAERVLAIQVLGRIAALAPEPPVAALRKALGDDDAAVRRYAASAVGVLRAVETVPELVQLAREGDDEVATAAIWSLGQMRGAAAAAVPVLAERLAEWENQSQAAMILTALGEIGAPAEPVIPAIVEAALEGVGLESNAFPTLLKLGPAGQAAIVEIVADGSGNLRAFAIDTIMRLGAKPPGLRAALEKAVQDPNARTRQTALRALPHVPAEGELNVEALMNGVLNSPLKRYNQSHVPHFLAKSARPDQLIPYVKHADERARWAAWYALGLMEKVPEADRRVLDPMALQAATAKESWVRWAATGYIAKFPPTAVSHALLSLLADPNLSSMQPKLVAALVKLDDPAPIVKALEHKDVAVRRGAAAVAQAYGPRAREGIAALFQAIESDPKHRYVYTRALIAMREHSLEVLIALIKQSKSSSERRMLSKAIGELGDAALPNLRLMLKKGVPAERRIAVSLLGQLGEKALAELLTAARDPDLSVRRATYYQLSRLPQHAERTIPVFVEGLADKDTTMAALQALRKMGPKALPWIKVAAASKAPAVRTAAMKGAPTLGEDAVPILIEGLRDTDAKVRAQAANSLSYLRQKAVPAIPALRRALKDPEHRVRQEAAWAISHAGASAEIALPDLAHLFGTGTSSDRRAVAKSLERIGAPSVPFLVKFLGKEDQGLAEAAVRSLGKIGGPAAPLVAAALIDGKEPTRMRAGEALRRIGAPAVKPLANLLDHKSHDVRRIAAWRLGQLQRVAIPAIPELIVALQDTNTYVVSQAAWALGEIGPAAKDALPELEKLYKAGRHRAIVKDAMRKIRA